MAFAGLLKEDDITAALAACQGKSLLPGTDRARIRGFSAKAVTESHKQSIFIYFFLTSGLHLTMHDAFQT